MTEVQNAETLAAADLLAAAAIVAAQADTRHIPHWTDLANKLTNAAAREAATRLEQDDTP